MGPLRGDGNAYQTDHMIYKHCREDGSPSWGRKLLETETTYRRRRTLVEKMGPLRGDGNNKSSFPYTLMIIW